MASDSRIGDVVLEVKDLQTYFVTRWGVTKAVDGVSFNLRKGETLGIVGESGSGKSSLARALLGIENAEGAIEFDGIDIKGLDLKSMREFKKDFQIVNINRIEALGLKEVNAQILKENGLIRSALKPVKILGNGDIKSKIDITATVFSQSAKEKIEKAGGTAIVL